MLPKKHRLSKTAEVKHTASRGRSFFNPYLVLKSTKGETAKLTVIVSTKVSKKAVDRNRLKRIVRDEIKDKMKSLKPGNYVIIVKPSALKLPAADFRSEINKSLKNSKYLES